MDVTIIVKSSLIINVEGRAYLFVYEKLMEYSHHPIHLYQQTIVEMEKSETSNNVMMLIIIMEMDAIIVWFRVVGHALRIYVIKFQTIHLIKHIL